MKIVKNERFEDILLKAICLKDEGRKNQEIFEIFPKFRKEFKEIFKIEDLLVQEKNKIIPPQYLFQKIISQIELNKNKTIKNVFSGLSINMIFHKFHFKLVPLTLFIIVFSFFVFNKTIYKTHNLSFDVKSIDKALASTNNFNPKINQILSEEEQDASLIDADDSEVVAFIK